MYLLGVTMACLANPDTTVRHKERRRLRAQYVYQGRACVPRRFSIFRKLYPLPIYTGTQQSFLNSIWSNIPEKRDIVNTKQPIQLPWDVTRKNLHDAYKEYGQILKPGIRLMGYVDFRHFMKEQFPHVKFCKVEPKNYTQQHQPTQQQTQIQQQNQQIQTIERVRNRYLNKFKSDSLGGGTPNDNTTAQHHQQTFLVAPVPQLLPNGNIMTPQKSHESCHYQYVLVSISEYRLCY
ncbi:hypothetical protein NQ318_017763 [Aromia moschata]|uniref:Uncharacterized protein n=1 Tax=Aromia moschata TaxID=1265417 RepID=A0AAV8XUR9_9CUCU|nr:hypothetical protein NQ318_017763 [Aromia moschata]